MTTPSVCTLSSKDLAERVSRWKALGRRALRSRERTASGIRLVFTASLETVRELEDLVRAERECCAAHGVEWRVRRSGGEAWLEITAPEEVQPEPEVASILAAFLDEGFLAPAREHDGCSG